MLRAVLVTVGAAKLADRRFLILRRATGVPALLAEHLPQVIVDTVVSPLARRVLMPASADLARVGVVLRVGPRFRRRISRPHRIFYLSLDSHGLDTEDEVTTTSNHALNHQQVAPPAQATLAPARAAPGMAFLSGAGSGIELSLSAWVIAVRAAEPGIRVPASDRDCPSFTGVNEARRPCVAWANTEVPSAGTPALMIIHH